jgi:hypothetical protein
MNKKISKFLQLSFVAASFSLPALAQETPVTTTPRDFENPVRPTGPVWQAGVNLGYVAGTSAKFQGTRSGNSDAFNVTVETGTRVYLNDKWFVNAGLVSDNFFLSTVAGIPVPDTINTLRLNLGVGYVINDQWTVTGLASPSLYRFDDIRGNDFGASGGVVASFRQNAALSWSFGIIGSPDSDVPALPIIGVRWLINDHYTLEVGMPRTRITYRIEPNWTAYAGLDLNGTTFRSAKDLGTKTGNAAYLKYNDTLASYRDIHLGIGTGYEFTRGLRAEIETGCSVYREINFKEADQSVDFKPAPYVRVGLSARF